MSDGYGVGIFGKTILCRKSDAKKFKNLSDIDKKNIRVMINPGGTNEKFAHANLKNAQIIVFNENAEIPHQISIGNAPTALFEVLRLVEDEKIFPAVIIGVPVGFVGAADSKAELAKQNKIPFITVEGTKGGSPIAVAAVNAILYLL